MIDMYTSIIYMICSDCVNLCELIINDLVSVCINDIFIIIYI